MPAWKAGKVLWFDRLAGEGMVVDSKGTAYYVHYTAIDSRKKSKRKNLSNAKKVEFIAYENSYTRQVEKIRIKPPKLGHFVTAVTRSQTNNLNRENTCQSY